MKTRRTIALHRAHGAGAWAPAARPRRRRRARRHPRPRPRRAAASASASAEASSAVGRDRREPDPAAGRPDGSRHPERRAERDRSSSGRSTCRRPSTSTSRTRSPASRRPIRASRSTWDDHQATFKDDLNNAFAAGNAPDVINLSVSEGWVSEYAGKGLLLGLDTPVPQAVKDIYFPGLWKEQLIDGVNYQFPWYQGLNVELINKAHLREGRRRPSTTFPKTIDDLPALCKTILDKTGTRVRHPPDRQRPARPDGL